MGRIDYDAAVVALALSPVWWWLGEKVFDLLGIK